MSDGVDIDAVHRTRKTRTGSVAETVETFLTNGKGTRRQIAEALGCTYKAVECAVRGLKLKGSPLFAKVIDMRYADGSRRPRKARPPRPFVDRSVEARIRAELRIKAADNVTKALRSRTPLEEAWAK